MNLQEGIKMGARYIAYSRQNDYIVSYSTCRRENILCLFKVYKDLEFIDMDYMINTTVKEAQFKEKLKNVKFW